MDGPFQQWFEDAFQQLLLRKDLVERAFLFVMVAVRLSGFFCVGPLLGQRVVSWPVRIGLVGLLTLIVAPGLPGAAPTSSVVVQTSNEVPAAMPENASPSKDRSLAEDRSLDIVTAISREAVIGASLGFAVVIFLVGLKLAGEWLDRHSGLGIGSVMNPEYSGGGSAPTELIAMFCLVTLLVMQPVNGHLLVVRLVLDTFHSIPVGVETASFSVLELTQAMLRQAMTLGLRIVMPFVVVMSLLDMTLGFVRRSSRIELAPAAYAFRTAAALLILAATLPGIPESIAISVNDSIKRLGDHL